MSLARGARIGSYEIIAALGAGGMGEVYRARDPQLHREVAIKVLPAIVAKDAERLARFAREARVLASLNHPHIGAIYGFDDTSGVPALVLELVEGETLADRLARGPRPVKQALTIARDIADALDAAHERGIVHRDLKPANVMLSRDGVVKVLDFGVAKAVEAGPGASPGTPTASGFGTHAGIALGTAAYMSPEQARGEAVDKRSDVWAFGCVFYEMLAGKAIFARESVSHTIVAVLEQEPDWSALPADTPAGVRRLLQHCLARTRKERLRDIGDARLQVDDALSARAVAVPVVAGASSPRIVARERIAWGIAAITLFAALASLLYSRPPAASPAVTLTVLPPPGTTFPFSDGAPWPSVSPDGRQLAFIAVSNDGRQALWLRSLDRAAARLVEGTEGAMRPFWSPDSQSVGYFADGRLWRVDLPDGRPQALAAAPYSGGLKGTWGSDAIVFQHAGLHRVSPQGGPATRMASALDSPGRDGTVIDNFAFVPDGIRYLFLRRSLATGKGETCIGTLDAPEHTCILPLDSPARFAPPGYLLFVQDAVLKAQRFELDRMKTIGDAVRVSDMSIRAGEDYQVPPFSASLNGVLAYHPNLGHTQLVWLDRSGRRLEVAAPPNLYIGPSLSRDEHRLVVHRPDLATGNVDLWLYDLARGSISRLTFDEARDSSGVFSPDGAQVAYSSGAGAAAGLYRKAVRGVTREEEIVRLGRAAQATDWSSDGRYVLIQQADQKTSWDVWAVPLEGDRKPYPVVATEHGEREGRFSPDVRWIAYDSSESGRREVWVQPFPPTGGRWQASTTGGFSPRWRGDGKELFYVAADGRLMAVPITAGASVEFGAAVPLFQTMFREEAYGSYAVDADGKRFLVNVPPEGRDASPITVVVNWPELLRR